MRWRSARAAVPRTQYAVLRSRGLVPYAKTCRGAPDGERHAQKQQADFKTRRAPSSRISAMRVTKAIPTSIPWMIAYVFYYVLNE